MIGIGIDIDGVLADTDEHLIAWANERLGLALTRADIKCFKVEDCTPITAGQVAAWLSDPEFYAGIKPLPGAAQALAALPADEFMPCLITARPHALYQVTIDWLRLAGLKGFTLIHNPDKAKVAAWLGLKWFVEDNIDNARLLAGVCQGVWLVDAPYNQGSLPANVKRVAGLAEALGLIKACCYPIGK